jgi:uncharacterized membrane protein YkvA (DUF1232 family)
MSFGIFRLLLIVGGLLYFLSPVDILPDFIFPAGWADDALLGYFLYSLYKRRKGSYSGNNENQSTAGSGSRSAGKSALKNPYEILDVSSKASKEEIKSAYRKLAAQYHPDKVNHLGEELQQVANRKFREIQEAYEKLKEND